MRAQLSTHDYEQLSAYLDGQLASSDRTRLEARLKTRPELQVALEDLRQTRALLRMAPRKRAPRNFTLTPAMVGDMPPARKARRGWGGFNLFPALSFASAMAALLLVAVILFDFGPFKAQTAMQTAPEAAPAARLETTRPTEAAAVPAATQGVAANDSGAAGSSPSPQVSSGINPEGQAVGKAAASNGIPGGVMTWQGATGRGGGGDGMGGAGGSDSSSAIIRQYGLDWPSTGSITIPPQLIQPMPAAAAQAEAQPVQPNPQISGSGPIVGVPEQSQAGKIIEQKGIMGHPEQVTPGPTAEPSRDATGSQPPQVSDQPNPAIETAPDVTEPWYARSVAGLPALRLIEGGLLALALATGIAAFLVWRQRS